MKGPVKKTTYTQSNKPSKAKMDRSKADGASLCCGESEQMAN